MYQPLADLLRPTNLDEVCGQEHILGKGAVLRRLIDSGNIPNMIFYGPSGTGKTTVANIIAKQTNRTLYTLNATTASTADIKNIVAQLDTFMAPNGVLLYLDEIQSFNKKQQQSLLEHIENGKITLIASTTENPYFYVFNVLQGTGFRLCCEGCPLFQVGNSTLDSLQRSGSRDLLKFKDRGTA